jgi:putative aldouronate transport system permease protein
MYGIVIAFKDFSFIKGVLGSDWIGFENFRRFFSSPYLWRTIRNTLRISSTSLVAGFPVPIIFALLLNELRSNRYKKMVQTLSYFPHFVSIVVVIGLMFNLFSPMDGLVNIILKKMGFATIHFMQEQKWFIPLYVGSGIWQQFGWGSIIYLAALSSVPRELYEAATIDGAGRFKQIIHISLPSIKPTIVILLIMAIGSLMNVGFQKIILMYNPTIYEVADTISSFVYRKAILKGDYSYGAAVDLFNNVINFGLVYGANKISKKVSEIGIW